MYNGILNVYKEAGFTSHDVVARLRGILKQKRIGHTGTLDPDATGVLPVCLGKATRLCDMLTDKEKTYRAQLILGRATDTQDISGKIINEADINALRETVTDSTICSTVMSFVGEYSQMPPMYSAIRVNGKRLYELARAGMEIEREPRSVKIIAIRNLTVDYPYVSMEVECSKGTYIRTLCHDIGLRLGTYACMTSLERTKSGIFKKDSSYTLSQIEKLVKAESLDEKIIPTDKVFEQLNAIYIEESLNKLLYNGNPIRLENIKNIDVYAEDKQYRVYDFENRFIGIYKIKNNLLKPEKLFL